MVRIRQLFLVGTTGILLTAVAVLAQESPSRPSSGRQDNVTPWVDNEAIRRLAMQLKGMSGDKLDPDLLKQLMEFAKKNPNATEQQKQEFAKQFLKDKPNLKDNPQQLEGLLKGLGFDPKNPPPGMDWPQFDPKASPPQPSVKPGQVQPPSLPKPPASTNLPNQPKDPIIQPGGADVTDQPENPLNGKNSSVQPKQPGQTWNPDKLAENQKQLQQFTGWWEQNIGPLNETPAVQQLIKEILTNSAEGGAGTFGDLFKGDPNEMPDLGGGGGWKLPDFGFGAGASSTDAGFTPPSAPSGGSFGSFGGVGGADGSWLPVVVLVVVLAMALVLWWLWPKLIGQRDGEPRPLPGLGPWPIDPRRIADRESLVKAFEYLSVLVCGAGAKVWNHVTIAAALERASPHAEALADPLARLYAIARYTPANEELPPGALTEAREYLCELAGVQAP